MPSDGGPAFPGHCYVNASGETHDSPPGMSLRDYFAAKAMQAFASAYVSVSRDNRTDRELWDFSEPNFEGLDPEDLDAIALNAYDVADAMLAARERKPDAQ